MVNKFGTRFPILQEKEIIKILEGAAYSFYADKIDEETFKKLCAIDPTPNGKYQKWILRSYIKQITANGVFEDEPSGKKQNDRWIRLFWEDSYKLTEDLLVYNAIATKKSLSATIPYFETDIMKLKDFFSFDQLMRKIFRDFPQYKKLNAQGQIELKDPSSEVEKLYDKDGWEIISPKSIEASCKYGAGTRWCTAAAKTNYFNQYTKEGPLYIIIHHSEKGDEKWQFHFSTDSFMNANDTSISKRGIYSFPKEVLIKLNDLAEAEDRPSNFLSFVIMEYDSRKKIIALLYRNDLYKYDYIVNYTYKYLQYLGNYADSILREIDANEWDYIDDDRIIDVSGNTASEISSYKDLSPKMLIKDDLYEDISENFNTSFIDWDDIVFRLSKIRPEYENPKEHREYNEDTEKYELSNNWWGDDCPQNIYETGYSDEQIEEAIKFQESDEIQQQVNNDYREYITGESFRAIDSQYSSYLSMGALLLKACQHLLNRGDISDNYIDQNTIEDIFFKLGQLVIDIEEKKTHKDPEKNQEMEV